MSDQPSLPRRHLLLGAALALAGAANAAATSAAAADKQAMPDAASGPAPSLRLGILPFGTVQWVAETIRRNALDKANGFTLAPTTLANTESAKTALMGGAVDIAVSDWPFVAAQRSHGGTLGFVPFSSSLGGIMVPAGSPLRGLADLRGKRLGIAGGAADKSWLVIQAAARRQNIDLAKEAVLSFGAPPLLNATLQQGRLDALLTFWNFAARLGAPGYTELASVADCARGLGVPGPLVLVGYVFDQRWAARPGSPVHGFLRASEAALHRLQTDPAAWAPIRPLMQARDDREFAALRSRFIAGIAVPAAPAMAAQASQLLAALAAAGVGPAAALPPGTIWQGQG